MVVTMIRWSLPSRSINVVLLGPWIQARVILETKTGLVSEVVTPRLRVVTGP
jgi:hypothetical protein